MERQPVTDAQRHRIESSLPFVETLARRVAATMPHSIELGDLVQDGMLGLIDAAHRFDEARGIKKYVGNLLEFLFFVSRFSRLSGFWIDLRRIISSIC